MLLCAWMCPVCLCVGGCFQCSHSWLPKTQERTATYFKMVIATPAVTLISSGITEPVSSVAKPVCTEVLVPQHHLQYLVWPDLSLP